MPEFVPFRFEVKLYADGEQDVLCSGHFSEVSGLELTMEPKAIAEGGRNWGELQRTGPTKFSPVVLKRGVTDLNHLWSWFDASTRGANYGYRLTGTIEVYDRGRGVPSGEDGPRPVMIWQLEGVLPTRFKGPDLSSTANQVAIEELHLVHEGLTLRRSGGSSGESGQREAS
jgi:phage tail-like protein